eukprot:5087088-Pyramimonas_sp.AAC.1
MNLLCTRSFGSAYRPHNRYTCMKMKTTSGSLYLHRSHGRPHYQPVDITTDMSISVSSSDMATMHALAY